MTPSGGLDSIGWFIATTHQLIGHDKTAAVIGQPPGNRDDCIICQYETNPTPENKAAVEAAIGNPTENWRHRVGGDTDART